MNLNEHIIKEIMDSFFPYAQKDPLFNQNKTKKGCCKSIEDLVHHVTNQENFCLAIIESMFDSMDERLVMYKGVLSRIIQKTFDRYNANMDTLKQPVNKNIVIRSINPNLFICKMMIMFHILEYIDAKAINKAYVSKEFNERYVSRVSVLPCGEECLCSEDANFKFCDECEKYMYEVMKIVFSLLQPRYNNFRKEFDDPESIIQIFIGQFE